MAWNDPKPFAPPPSPPMARGRSEPVMSQKTADFFIAIINAGIKLEAAKRCAPAQSAQSLQSVSDDIAKALGNMMAHYDIKVSCEIVHKQSV